MRTGPGRYNKGGAPSKPGGKVAARFAKARGGDVYHTGELTKANQERAAKSKARKEAATTG